MFEIVNWTVCKLSKIIQQPFDIYLNMCNLVHYCFNVLKLINLSKKKKKKLYYIILQIKVLIIMIFLINCLT